MKKIILELYNDKKQILFVAFLASLEYLIGDLSIGDGGVFHASVGFVAVGAVLLGTYIHSSIKGDKRANDAIVQQDKNNQLTQDIADQKLAFQKVQQAKLDKQKDVYRSMEFKNPYANVENQYADLQTEFENTYEDLTVNQQQAQFEAQQGQQQRANIMQNLKGSAGGSGVAGLAQAMANQGQLATQKASASIGQQEQRNQQMKAQGAQTVQSMEATREQLIASGEGAADMTRRGGEATLQNLEIGRQSTLLGVSMGESAGANAAAMQAQQNQVAQGAAEANMYGQMAGAHYGTAAAAMQGLGSLGAGQVSDRKLKKNINLIGKSPSGLNIYSFEYKNLQFGKGLFQGVMSDELPLEAVEKHHDGYDRVNYNMLDVEFKQI